jgi:hypothetical protein
LIKINCTDKEYPKRLLKIKNIPRIIYAMGNIELLYKPGIAVIGKNSKAKSTASEIVHSLHNGIYAKIESKNAYYLGISTSNRSLDISSIAKAFVGIYDVFSGISEATTIVIASGMQWPQKRILRFKNKFEETVKNIPTTNFIHQLEPLQSLSFVERQTTQPTTSVNPRDILLGLLNN